MQFHTKQIGEHPAVQITVNEPNVMFGQKCIIDTLILRITFWHCAQTAIFLQQSSLPGSLCQPLLWHRGEKRLHRSHRRSWNRKNLVVAQINRNFAKTIDFVFIFNTNLMFKELLRAILHDLGLPTQGKDKLAMFEELNTYLIEQVKRGHIVCLLIDEVQNLSDESLEGLRLLSNFETDNEKLLQIVMMGQPEFKTKLNQPNLRQLKQRIALQFEIAPLMNEEVGAYINFRLQSAGYARQDLFHPEAIRKIAAYSKGIPRLINVICDNALVTAFAGSQKTVSAALIREVAEDLDLESKPQPDKTTNTFSGSPSKTESETLIRERPNRVFQPRVRRLTITVVGACLVILVFAVVSVVTDSQSFFGITERTLESFKDNSNKRVLPVHHNSPRK